MGELRFGVLGTGAVARAFTRSLRSTSLSVSAVGSRSESKAREFAHAFGIPHGHSSYESLIADRSVDVVYIATPAASHKAHALQALGAGKAVLIEKPFAVTAAEAAEIVAAARASRLFCMEAMWTRFLPVTQRFLARAKSGEIGELHHFHSDFGGPVAYDASNHRFDAFAGGAWLDRGIYGLSLAMALFGEPSSLRADAVVAPTGCDLQSHAILQFPNARTAVVSASNLAYTSNEAVIAGSAGRLRLSEPFVRSDAIRLRAAPASPAASDEIRAPAGLKQSLKSSRFARALISMLPRERREFVSLQYNGYGYQALEVSRCIAAGLTESPTMPLDESRAIMEVSDAVRGAWLQGNGEGRRENRLSR